MMDISPVGWKIWLDGRWQQLVGPFDVRGASAAPARIRQFQRALRRGGQSEELGGVQLHDKRAVLGGEDGQVGVAGCVVRSQLEVRDTQACGRGPVDESDGGGRQQIGDLNGVGGVEVERALPPADRNRQQDVSSASAETDIVHGEDGQGDSLDCPLQSTTLERKP